MIGGERKPFIVVAKLDFVSEETLSVDGLVESLSSRYEAVRASAATRLGRLPQTGPWLREVRWARDELKSLLERETSVRVRTAAAQALAQLPAK